MEPINILINDISVKAQPGSTIYQAASAVGVKIPTLCYMKDINEVGACRICVVEVKGARGLVASCVQPIEEGMEVKTDTPIVREARRTVLELLVSDHKLNCVTCEKSGICKLQDYCYEYDVEGSPFKVSDVTTQVDVSNQYYFNDPNKCIKCGICVAVCSKSQCNNAIGMIERGFKTHIGPPLEKKLSDSRCVSCGNCVSSCPVGALMPKQNEKFRSWEVSKIRTTCAYCGVGCELYLKVKGNRLVGAEPSNGPANKGLLCVKGKFGNEFVNHNDRLKTPMLKKDGAFVEISWSEAYKVLCEKIKDLKQRNGAEAFAGLASSKVTNEENYLFQKLFRAVIGTNNIDNISGLNAYSTVYDLTTTLGSNVMTNSIDEIRGSDLIFVTGTDITQTHPVIGAKIRQAKLLGAKIIVADSRKIDLVEDADVFLQITPGTLGELFNGLLNVIISENLQNKEFIKERTENYEELENVIKNYSPDKVAQICGIDSEELKNVARMYATAKNASIFYSMAEVQNSKDASSEMSISALALICGQIGRESTGVNRLSVQNNAQGASDMGALPSDFTGYQKVSNPEIIRKFEKEWGVKLSDKTGLTVSEMLNEALIGKIKFMYIMGENPMLAAQEPSRVESALENLEFLVVQDIFLTKTAELADLVLPAATFAEKDGTFTNTERRVQRVRRAINPIGTAKADWLILMDIMNQLGYDIKYQSPAEIMDEIASVTPIYGGISYGRIEHKGIQWPCIDNTHKGTKYLHADKFTRGKGLIKLAE